MSRIEVGILGATGIVGQQLVSLLEDHPWFEHRWLAASAKSVGRRYAEVCNWRLAKPMPADVRGLVVCSCEPAGAPRLVFSALDSVAAEKIETEFARCGHIVVSNASSHRMDPDVPLVIPEINPGHLALLSAQKSQRSWKGMIVTNPNCTTAGLAITLTPLERNFGLKQVLMTSLQAISGAGYPGLPGLDILGNVIPYIPDEEEKVERETRKILGQVVGGRIEPGRFAVSAQCNRVAVEHGHMESISVSLRSQATLGDVVAVWRSFSGLPQERRLPSAPERTIIVREEPDRPQPRMDVYAEGGRATIVGRLRPCSVLQFKYTALSHNLVRGAAGAALLNAELLHSEGLLN